MNQARLHVFTGKGGVGKTAFSLAYARTLQQRGQKVLYHQFDQSTADSDLCTLLGLQELKLTIDSSSLAYMEKKLGSAIIAQWIFKTPFFRALLDMLPGLGHMILLGHIIDLLQNDEQLSIVIDSPSSGHALTMFEASHNFREIFKTGLIVNDIEKMHQTIERPNFLKTVIITLPTMMALQEAKDLQTQLKTLKIEQTNIWLNDSFAAREDLQESFSTLPDFLQTKIKNENLVLESDRDQLEFVFPRYSTSELIHTVEMLAQDMIARFSI